MSHYTRFHEVVYTVNSRDNSSFRAPSTTIQVDVLPPLIVDELTINQYQIYLHTKHE